jgi:hypothetical protein
MLSRLETYIVSKEYDSDYSDDDDDDDNEMDELSVDQMIFYYSRE